VWPVNADRHSILPVGAVLYAYYKAVELRWWLSGIPVR